MAAGSTSNAPYLAVANNYIGMYNGTELQTETLTSFYVKYINSQLGRISGANIIFVRNRLWVFELSPFELELTYKSSKHGSKEYKLNIPWIYVLATKSQEDSGWEFAIYCSPSKLFSLNNPLYYLPLPNLKNKVTPCYNPTSVTPLAQVSLIRALNDMLSSFFQSTFNEKSAKYDSAMLDKLASDSSAFMSEPTNKTLAQIIDATKVLNPLQKFLCL